MEVEHMQIMIEGRLYEATIVSEASFPEPKPIQPLDLRPLSAVIATASPDTLASYVRYLNRRDKDYGYKSTGFLL